MISKKRLLEIEKQRKEKLYSRGSGKRNVASSTGKIGVMVTAFVLVLGAGFLIFYANSTAPVKEKAVKTMAEVAVVEEQKEVGVIEELEVQLHPALKKKAEEAQKAPEEVNLTFYDNLSKAESSPLTVEEKHVEVQPKVEVVQEVPATSGIKEKKTVVKSVLQQPEVTSNSKPVVSTKRDFRIQISSFRDEKDAIKRKKQLVNDGFNATTETIDLGVKGIWHRVYVEDYVSRNDAKSDLNKISKKYNIKPFIVKKP